MAFHARDLLGTNRRILPFISTIGVEITSTVVTGSTVKRQ